MHTTRTHARTQAHTHTTHTHTHTSISGSLMDLSETADGTGSVQ